MKLSRVRVSCAGAQSDSRSDIHRCYRYNAVRHRVSQRAWPSPEQRHTQDAGFCPRPHYLRMSGSLAVCAPLLAISPL
jgi:hypothetical protein